MFRELERSGDLDRALTAVVEEFPSVPVSEIRSDVDRLLEGLLRRGLLVPRMDHVWQAGGTPMTLAAPADVAVPLHVRVLATMCVFAAVVLLRFPFRTVIKAVATLKRALVRRGASRAEGEGSVSAVSVVSGRLPFQVACMELSLAAVLWCAIRGRSLDWCFGHSVDPIAFHSWVEVDGKPLRGAREEPVVAVYQRIFSV